MKTYLALFLFAGALGSVEGGDRVYTAEQTSNMVLVIDPATNKYLGSIHLGEDVPVAISPLYRGELLVHGMDFSPDHKTIDVISIGSNSVTLIDTETNKVKGKIYIGRSPHEGFFTPDGHELWVAGSTSLCWSEGRNLKVWLYSRPALAEYPLRKPWVL